MKRFERDGRWVEVGKIRQTYGSDGSPCYEIDGRGDWAFYLGDTDPLSVQETTDGWTIQYRPTDDNFDEYAQTLVALNEWGRRRG